MMPLLTERGSKQIIDSIRNAEFKDKCTKVPYWSLRYVCALISLFFFIITPVLYFNGRGLLCAIPLLLAICWLLVGIVFHVLWLRYMEIAAVKVALSLVPEKDNH